MHKSVSVWRRYVDYVHMDVLVTATGWVRAPRLSPILSFFAT